MRLRLAPEPRTGRPQSHSTIVDERAQQLAEQNGGRHRSVASTATVHALPRLLVLTTTTSQTFTHAMPAAIQLTNANGPPSPHASTPHHHRGRDAAPLHLASEAALPEEGLHEDSSTSFRGRLTRPQPNIHISVRISDPIDKDYVHTTSDVVYANFLHNHALSSATAAKPNAWIHTWPWFLQWPMFFVGYTCDAHVQRGTAAIYMTLCIIGVIWRSSPWLWYVVAGLTTDAGLRAAGGDRLGVLSCMAEMVTTFLPRSFTIATAPRQFAAMFYTAWNFVCVMVTGYVIHDDGDHNALGTLLGLQAFMQLLETLDVSLPALFFERVLVGRGLISDAYRHKSEATIAEVKLKEAVTKAKLQHSGAKHTVAVTQPDGALLMRFDGVILAARSVFDPIRHCHIGYCFPLLGVAGLTDLFYYGTLLVGLNSYVWKSLAVCLGVLYSGFYLVQLARCFLVPSMMLREIRHPHFRYIFLIAITVPLLSIDFMISVSLLYCKIILWICGPLALVGLLTFVKDWVEQPTSFDLFNASWFIAAISLIVTAFALPQVYPDLSELAWLWLAIGLFMWVLLTGLVFVRLVFRPSLPDSQRSTLFLLISTGAICTAAVLIQDPQAFSGLTGPYSALAEFFHWLTTFIALLLYTLLLHGYFCRSAFNMSYWAISFPSTVLAILWLFYWQVGNCDLASRPTQYSSEERCTDNQDSVVVRGVVIMLFVNACVSNSVLAVNTVLALLQKRLFLPMPQWSPAVVLHLQHSAFRTALHRSTALLERLVERAHSGAAAPTTSLTGPQATATHVLRHRFSPTPVGATAACPCTACAARPPATIDAQLHECLELLGLLDLSLHTYHCMKRDVLWPMIHEWLPNVHVEHIAGSTIDRASEQLHGILVALDVLVMSRPEMPALEAVLKSIQQHLQPIARTIHLHLDHEEVLLNPLLHFFTDLSSAHTLMQRIWGSIDTSTQRVILPWLLSNMPDHAQRMALIDCYSWSAEGAISTMGRWMSKALDPFLYQRLCVDYPQLKLTVASPYSKFW